MTESAQQAQRPRATTRDEYRRRRQLQQQVKLKKIRRQRILISVAIVLAVLVMMVAIDLVGNAGKIHNGVEVDGIALGGKTPAKARAYLTSELHRGQDKPIKVTYGQQSWQISPADLGVKYDTAQMVSDAWKIGRESNIFKATTMRIISYFHPQTVMLQIDSDPAKESTLYDKITIVTNKSPVNASVTLKDGTFVASGGSDGTALQKQTLTNLITYASLGGQKTVKAPVEIAHRTIDLAKAQLAAKTAQDATKDMIAAQYQDKTWQLEPKVLSGLIIFKLSNDLDKNMAQLKLENQKGDTPSDITLVPIVGSENVAKSVIPLLGATVGTAPVDASFQAANGEVTIIPSKNGLGADPVKLANELATQMQSTTATKKVTVVTHEVAPALTTAKAQALGIKERISTYTTYFSGGNKARLTNITLMAKAFDGTIVMPGKTFSLNGTVGEANAAKGYQEAGAIVDGQPTSQVGGGICQVNTTLFNAALFAGVRITERTNHSLFISSYPLGRDAAVSWPSPDFKFVNSLDHAILIVTSSSNSSVTVSFYGMDPGYTVELGPASWLSHTQAPEQRVNDPTLPAGTEKIKQPGRGGGRVTFTQTVKRADGSIVFTKTFVSNYKTEAKIILVGTKPVSATPAPTPAPTPTKTANSTR